MQPANRRGATVKIQFLRPRSSTSLHSYDMISLCRWAPSLIHLSVDPHKTRIMWFRTFYIRSVFQHSLEMKNIPHIKLIPVQLNSTTFNRNFFSLISELICIFVICSKRFSYKILGLCTSAVSTYLTNGVC